jgi:flavorubredoxin
MATIQEILEGMYCISTFDERIGLSFNQYLLRDEKPVLVHTGSAQMFGDILERIREVMDPAQIAYAFISHFESDECGALSQWLGMAPGLVPVGSAVTARQLLGFGITDRTQVGKDGDLLDLGRRRLRFVPYPSEMHLWEGLLAFEDTERILFSADLFIGRGPTPATVMRVSPKALVIPEAAIPSDEDRATCLARIQALQPSLVAPGHGSVLDIRPE